MAKDKAVLRFSVVLKEVPVQLVDKDGHIKNYTLREFDGRSRDDYMNCVKASVLTDKAGNVTGFKTFEGIQSGLLSRCLFDQMDKQVSEETIQSFPATMMSQLFNEAQKINGLAADEAELEQVKND